MVKARGARLRNRVICIRERASAMALSVPGICYRTTVKVWLAATKNNLLTSTMSSGLLEVPEDQISTTACLSQCTKSFLPPPPPPPPGVPPCHGRNYYCEKFLPLNGATILVLLPIAVKPLAVPISPVA